MNNGNYQELNAETKALINKAIEIYLTIKDKNINQIVPTIIESKQHTFTKCDKKVLALFTAAFLIKGAVNDIVDQYDELKLDDLLDFMKIHENDIKPLEINYQEIYEKEFRILVLSTVNQNMDYDIINLSAATILSFLCYSHCSGSEIIDYFIKKYTKKSSFGTHAVFDCLKSQAVFEGNMKRKVREHNGAVEFDLFTLLTATRKPKNAPIEEEDPIKKTLPTKEEIKKLLLSDKTKELIKNLEKKFIGQEKAAKQIFLNIVNNQCLTNINDITARHKSVIFIDGPSGTGKTAICNEIVQNLDIGIPIVKTAITQYSKTGYVGGEINSILSKLLTKAGNDLELAQHGVVILDELEKVGQKEEDNISMKKAMQEELLDFIGGGKYNVSLAGQGMRSEEIEFDTSGLTFVGLGAFSELREKKIKELAEKNKQNRKMGFGNREEENKNEVISENQANYIIDKQDMIDFGIIPELANRFNVFLHTDDYDQPTLKRQLLESTISPIIALRQWIEFFDKELVIDDDVYDTISERAYALKSGARGNETVVDSIRNLLTEEVLFGKNHTIHLTTEMVIESEKGRLYQRVRG